MIFFGDKRNNFLDGVGYNWIDSLKQHAESVVSDSEFELKKENDCHSKTHEAVWYKNIYDELFKTELPIKRWIPRTDWNGVGYDPVEEHNRFMKTLSKIKN